MVTALGRAVMPRRDTTFSEFVADELLRCELCGEWMRPVSMDGARTYSCGRACPQPDLAAEPVELDLALGAVTRAVTVLHPDLARVQQVDADLANWAGAERPHTDESEVRRWQACDLSDRRAMVRVAYLRVDVDGHGELQPIWRHRSGEAPCS
ncbi:MAG: hypothetical protein ACRDT6_19340 [Micromonosporaceae bacterium]